MNAKRGSRQRTTGGGDQKLSMPRYMWWEKEYAEHPYMRSLPMKDLNERFHDFAPNMLTISDDGKVGIQSASNGVEWARYLQHVHAEANARDLPFPYFLDKRHEPDWSMDGLASSVKNRHSKRAFNAVKAWANAGGDRQFSVVKYGEGEHMERFLHDGEVLVSPSATFDDKEFNRALRDDENSIGVFGVRMKDGTAVPANDLPGWLGDRYSMTDLSSTADRDYMLYCMSSALSPTLFSQFGKKYDACVLIHDMDEFVTRMEMGTRERLPQGKFVHGHCRTFYFDPLGAIPLTPKPPKKSRGIPIPFLKHFRHTYQKEYRFVWVPTEPRRGFEPACISIGSLEDIAEIIRI